MYFCHTAAIWQEFPQLVPGLLVVERIHPDADVAAHLEPWYQRARERLSRAAESELPEVAAWRRAYAQMGMKPTQYRSAAEALLRRFRREDALPRLHPLVDLCNAASLAYALPVAVFDLDRVDTFLEVRHAAGDEQYLDFSGAIERPAPGEVIFADAARQVHARRWTFRQSLRSTIQSETRRALIVGEGLHATADADVRALIEALATVIAVTWSAPAQRAILSAEAPRLTWTLGSGE
jgi:DNA/RNA-binding domain of Phe-tRNA-synthetase-like protein